MAPALIARRVAWLTPIALAAASSCTSYGEATTAEPLVDAGETRDVDASTDATMDAPVFTGGNSRCPAQFLACDGFEDASVNRTTWSFIAGAPTPTTFRQARGQQSLEIRIADGPDGGAGTRMTTYVARTQDLTAFPQTYGRAFVFVRSTNVPEGSFIYFYSYGGGTYPHISLGVRQGRLHLDDNTRPAAGFTSSLTLPTDRWVCLELAVTQAAGVIADVHAWMDDVEITDFGASGPYPPQADTFQVGFEGNRSKAGTFDMWVDEVVQAASRIGCAN